MHEGALSLDDLPELNDELHGDESDHASCDRKTEPPELHAEVFEPGDGADLGHGLELDIALTVATAGEECHVRYFRVEAGVEAGFVGLGSCDAEWNHILCDCAASALVLTTVDCLLWIEVRELGIWVEYGPRKVFASHSDVDELL